MQKHEIIMKDKGLSLMELLAFGALISSTDPVSCLAIFPRLQVDPTLFTLILGEYVLIFRLIELCHGSLSMPMCHGYHIEGSYRVVHFRANAGLVFFYRILQYTISLA